MRVVEAQGSILERIVRTAPSSRRSGLTQAAYATYDRALRNTAWARRSQRRLALVDGTALLASACCYELTAILDARGVRVCGIGDAFADPEQESEGGVGELLERMVDAASQDGADMALLFVPRDQMSSAPGGFTHVPTTDLELTVEQSLRYGAPMTLVRGGEDRDLAAIAAMGEVRGLTHRFHLVRDVDLIKYAVTRKRLRAGLAAASDRQLHFVIAEEGITAAAYVVITVEQGTWTIEECGDRDPSGARVGALLQALIALEPAERRPVIRAWLPSGFLPPQVAIASARPSQEAMMVRMLDASAPRPCLADGQALYWRSDIF